jgi:hypothetical protein
MTQRIETPTGFEARCASEECVLWRGKREVLACASGFNVVTGSMDEGEGT